MEGSMKSFIVQIGMGVDQHGHNKDCSNAAIKAIKNAISNNCLSGLFDICHLKNPRDMKVHVKIAAPYPESVNHAKVLKSVPFGEKSIEVVQGGLLATGIMVKELGDNTDEIVVCNAAVSVSVNTS